MIMYEIIFKKLEGRIILECETDRLRERTEREPADRHCSSTMYI